MIPAVQTKASTMTATGRPTTIPQTMTQSSTMTRLRTTTRPTTMTPGTSTTTTVSTTTTTTIPSDDDIADDDSGNDDSADDDISDDDTTILPTPVVKRLEGGLAGDSGVSICRLDNAVYIAACKAHELMLFHKDDGLSEWQQEIIDAWAAAPSLTVSSTGDVHLAYYNSPDSTLKYARRNSNGWSIEVIESGADKWNEYYRCHIKLDAADQPIIAFYSTLNGHLKLTSKGVGGWNLVDLGVCGRDNDFVIDGNGYFHFTHTGWNGNRWAPFYLTNLNGSWLDQLIDDGIDFTRYLSLAVDTNGAAHVCYSTDEVPLLKYAVNTGGSWHMEDVTESEYFGITNIALDRDGLPRILYSYYDLAENGFRYAQKNAAGEWEVLSFGGEGMGGEAAWTFAESDVIEIAVSDGYSCKLYYLNNQKDAWELSILDEGALIIAPISLMVDSKGRPHFSFYDKTHDRLQYGVLNGEDWMVETVAQQFPYKDPQHAVLADKTGRVFVCYSEYEYGLYCAMKGTNGWEAQSVDPNGFIGDFLLDGDDRPMLLFSAPGTRFYKAVFNGVSWDIELMLETTWPPGSGLSTHSAAIDADGMLNFCYENGYMGEFNFRCGRINGQQWEEYFYQEDYCSPVLAIDQNNYIHIHFLDSWLTEGWYATNETGDWEIVPLELYPGNLTANRNNVLLAAARTMYSVVIARKTASGWEWLPIDSGVFLDGPDSMIALGPAGRVHYAYLIQYALYYAGFQGH